MTNTIANRQAICDVLLRSAETDRDIVVLCSDSRGSSSLAPFAVQFPKQFVEVGIAEQNLVSVAAGLGLCGKKAFAASPACFLSTRSMEQVKVDVAYSHSNVKLIGISGGISYGALGMTHHSAQDIAALSAIPGMRVYLPSDRHQTARLMETLLQDKAPAYIRVGRNPVEDIYTEKDMPFVLNKATLVHPGNDVTVIACGEMVFPALQAARKLRKENIGVRVLDMYCVKPIDRKAVLQAAQETKAILTMEEHSAYGGLGSMVSQIVSAEHPAKVVSLSLPDEPVITGTSQEVFDYYGLNAAGLASKIREVLL